VTPPAIHVSRLQLAEAALYRDIRLESLRLAPEAFGAAFSGESDKSLEWFADRLARSEVFGAFRGGELLGVATFVAETGEKVSHRGSVFGVYVRPEEQGSGIGRQLMQAVIASARGKVDQLHLTVNAASEPAQHLYASLGFITYGRVTDGLRVAGRSFDEILMALDLRDDP